MMAREKKDSDGDYDESPGGERDEGGSSRSSQVERQIRSNDLDREFDPKKTSS
jgi:hypothetical protein